MRQMSAETHIHDDAIRPVIEKLRIEHRDYEIDTGVTDKWEFRTHYGSLTAELAPGCAHIKVFAADETCLSYMKMAVAAHLAEHFGDTRGLRWQGDGQDAGRPVFFRELRVVAARNLSPHLRRLRFQGADLQRFSHGGLHVRLLLPPKDRAPVWPTVGQDGLILWPKGNDALTIRVYTIRAIDPAAGWVDIDFVIHAGSHSPGSAFAEMAVPGDVIGMIGPGGGDVPDAGNLLLLGDDTALPAISRILEQLPPATRAEAIIEVDSPADAIAPQREGTRITWLYREGRAAGTTGLLVEALRALGPHAPEPDLYVWAASEFQDFRAIRSIFRKAWGLKRDRHLAVAYWRRGVAGESDDESEEG
ncbi:siderophore-interacting protein [Taklimakanibacter lacteus]|uniref:siderophore-interacting protein n=1 Tax=Taklimakanibacter lacteus TaxID=2268456 RepID=UPI000E6710A9